MQSTSDKFNPTEVAKNLTIPKYHKYLPNWLTNATSKELKGLKIISMIIKNKGQKLFRPLGRQSLPHHPEPHKLSYFKSSYDSDFNNPDLQLVKDADVLKYRKLSELPCSSVLDPLALRMLQNWVLLSDSVEFQALVLQCLRGVYSTVKVFSSTMTTQHRQNFTWKLPEVKSLKKLEIIAKVPTPRKRHTEQPCVENTMKSAEGALQTAQNIKKKYAGMNKNLLVHTALQQKPVSSYQLSYPAHFCSRPAKSRNNFYVSSSVKLLPDFS